ncbi:MAG TPA: GNAT family N-acetyltransferase [Burkholderiaceae bacterium]|nr:GNAT family N-acetyltransferase [Burkholderiaceae bacterium]
MDDVVLDYPIHLIRCLTLRNGAPVLVRPILASDGPAVQAFFRGLSAHTRYLRFFMTLPELTPALLAHIVAVDYRRRMTFAAFARADDGRRLIGVAQYVAADESPRERAEVALVLDDRWQGRGLGRLLLLLLADAASDAGVVEFGADVLAENRAMLSLARASGFAIEPHADGAMFRRLRMRLAPAAVA